MCVCVLRTQERSVVVLIMDAIQDKDKGHHELRLKSRLNNEVENIIAKNNRLVLHSLPRNPGSDLSLAVPDHAVSPPETSLYLEIRCVIMSLAT